MHIKSGTGKQGWILKRDAGHTLQIRAKKHTSCHLASSTVTYTARMKHIRKSIRAIKRVARYTQNKQVGLQQMKSAEQNSRIYCSLFKRPGSWLTFYYTQQRTFLTQSGKTGKLILLQFLKKMGGAAAGKSIYL